MITAPKKRLLDFLIEHKTKLFIEWENRIHESPNDSFKKTVIQSRDAIFQNIMNIISKPEDDLELYIRQIAHKIIEKQVHSNIGDFVNNVNTGRTVLFQYIMEMSIEWTELKKIINELNLLFDKFTYYAVTCSKEAKDQVIKEKNTFNHSTHQDRLTLLGQMTSSFIHEFRNPLTSIQGFVQLLKAEFQDLKYLDIIQSELEQLNFRISQFLLLSKKEINEKEKAHFSLNKLVEEVLTFLYPSILNSKVTVVNNLGGKIRLIGYADEIRQVFINLIFNALDVLCQYRSDPVIWIDCTKLERNNARIIVSNNGPMIPQSQIADIFEPFVTTKKLGTGLGLFVCREIIEKHKGSLTCVSIPEQTNFIITLPLADGD